MCESRTARLLWSHNLVFPFGNWPWWSRSCEPWLQNGHKLAIGHTIVLLNLDSYHFSAFPLSKLVKEICFWLKAREREANVQTTKSNKHLFDKTTNINILCRFIIILLKPLLTNSLANRHVKKYCTTLVKETWLLLDVVTYIFFALFSNFVARGGRVNLRGKSNRNLIVPFCLPPFARSKQRTHLVVQSSQEEEIQLDSNTHREDHIGSQIMAGSNMYIYQVLSKSWNYPQEQIWNIWADLAFNIVQGVA